jgi:hypothetical protein
MIIDSAEVVWRVDRIVIRQRDEDSPVHVGSVRRIEHPEVGECRCGSAILRADVSKRNVGDVELMDERGKLGLTGVWAHSRIIPTLRVWTSFLTNHVPSQLDLLTWDP